LAADQAPGLADGLLVLRMRRRGQFRGRPGRERRHAELDALLHQERVEEGVEVAQFAQVGAEAIDGRGRALLGQCPAQPVVGVGCERGRRGEFFGVEHVRWSRDRAAGPGVSLPPGPRAHHLTIYFRNQASGTSIIPPGGMWRACGKLPGCNPALRRAAAHPAANEAARAVPVAAGRSPSFGKASGASRSGLMARSVCGPAPDWLYRRPFPSSPAAPMVKTDRASPGTATPPAEV